MPASPDVIRSGITPVLARSGVDLEELQIQAAGRREIVRVVIDRDGGVDLDLIADVSRQLAELLDAEPLASQFATTYVLEVTSPGVDRPLTEPKHWRRALHRLVEARLRDGSAVTGRIVAVDDAGVTLDVDGLRTIAFTELDRGAVQVEFNRADSANASSVDDVEDGDDVADEQEG